MSNQARRKSADLQRLELESMAADANRPLSSKRGRKTLALEAAGDQVVRDGVRNASSPARRRSLICRKGAAATLKLYDLDRGKTTGFGWQCLIARRLVERGVRFVELIDTGSSSNWDSHGNMQEHVPLARNVDRAIAGLILDLKSRGMLDDTLVVVGTTEFGHGRRTTNRPNHPGWRTSSSGLFLRSWPAAAVKGRNRPRLDDGRARHRRRRGGA